MSETKDRICVLGAGSWGTALALHLARKGEPVSLWVRETDLALRMTSSRENDLYLPGFSLPPDVFVSSSLAEACRGAGRVLLVVPSRFCRSVLKEAKSHLPGGPMMIVAAKGIEGETLLRISQVAEEVMGGGGHRGVAVLSGPSFAREVAANMPTAVVMAAAEEAMAEESRALLAGDRFRVYTSTDRVGVEIGGAFKNIIAIAAGVVEGLGLGYNTMAALVTRGLAEISRLALALGGRRETLAGLAGMGDLILTCTGSLSRNRKVGIALGEGRSLAEILKGMTMVAEGVETARTGLALARREGIDMPIAEQIHRLLCEGKPPRAAIAELMERPPRPESD